MAVLAAAGRGVVLTPAEKAIVESAPDVFQALERCAEAGRSGGRRCSFSWRPSGGGVRDEIGGLLAPATRSLAKRCPQLRLLITEQDPQEATRSVEAGTADLALVHDADGLPASVPSTLIRRHVHTDVGDVVMTRRIR